MAHGGSITKRDRNVYEVSCQLGKDEEGRYVRASRRVHGTKRDAIAALDELKHFEKGREPKATVTFGRFSEEWLAWRSESGEYARATLAYWRRAITQLNGYLSEVDLADISPRLLEQVHRSLKVERGQSGTTLQHTHKVAKQIMQQAVDYGLIEANPADKVKAPKREPVDRGTLAAEDFAKLMHSLERLPESSCTVAVRLGLATGARRGEVLGLRWKDIDLEAGMLFIRRSLAPGCAVKDTKTLAGRRTIALDAETVGHLGKWRRTQESRLRKAQNRWCPETPVVADARGGWMEPTNFSRWWRRFAAEAGFEGLKFHELRHTQATLLLAAGTDLKTVQARLGHANASVTMNFYAHALPECDRRAAETIGRILQG